MALKRVWGVEKAKKTIAWMHSRLQEHEEQDRTRKFFRWLQATRVSLSCWRADPLRCFLGPLAFYAHLIWSGFWFRCGPESADTFGNGTSRRSLSVVDSEVHVVTFTKVCFSADAEPENCCATVLKRKKRPSQLLKTAGEMKAAVYLPIL